ncbi:MAG: hypothetical protein ACK5QR_00010 [bacterium]
MARTKSKFIEPTDLPPVEREAITIFHDAGWQTDAEWLGPLALKSLGSAESAEAILDFCTNHNLKLLARALPDAGGVGSRDSAMMMVLARLCGCGGKDAALARKPAEQSSAGHPEPIVGLQEWKSLGDALRAQGAKLEGTLVSRGWPGNFGTAQEIGSQLAQFARYGPRDGFVPDLIRLMQGLADGASLDLTRVIDGGSLVARGCQYMSPDHDPACRPRIPKSIDRCSSPDGSPRELTTWLITLGPRVLRHFLPVWLDWKNDSYGAAMVLGIRGAIECWLMHCGHHWTYFREAGPALAEACLPYFAELTHRCRAGDAPVHPELRRAWLWFAWCVFEADPNLWNAQEPAVRQAVLRAANEDVAALRKLFARARPKPIKDLNVRDLIIKSAIRRGVQPTLGDVGPEQLCEGWGHLFPADSDGPNWEKTRAPWEEFECERDHLQTCLFVLFQRGGVWLGIKPMLLGLRALAAPAVAPDLRYWSEPDREPPPEPWNVVLEWPINLFHSYVGAEQRSDPELLSLRSQFASFCLERLVDRWGKAEREQARRDGRQRTNDDMIERSPEWRYGYVRAVSVLGVNPEGKGHRVLNTAAEIDPDPDVREAAKHAYEQLRRGVGLPDDTSPRRAIMSALWWLRQGHLYGLEIQPDADGAQRTRMKELTRTKEAERPNVPATR